MPTVRAYGARQVQQRPLQGGERDARPGAAPTAQQLGAGAFEALADVGTQAANIGLKGYAEQAQAARDRADQVAVLEASNKLGLWKAQRLYDPASGALTSTKGKDTFGLPTQIDEEFGKVTGDITAGLSNNTQRDAFARLTAQEHDRVRMDVYQHVDREMQSYYGQQAEQGVKLATFDAVQHAGDPTIVSQNMTKGAAILTDHLKGQAPETVQAAILAFQSDTNTGVIDQLLATGKDRAAQAYFDETKHQLTPEAIVHVENSLKEGNLRGESQRQADAIGRTATTLTEARDAVKAIEDPNLRDKVQERVEHDWSVRQAAQRDAEESTMTDAVNRLERSGGNLSAIPAGTWAAMPLQSRTALKAYAKSLAPGGKDIETDLPTYYGLMTQASTNPEQFKDVNLLGYVNRIGKVEFKQLTELQSSIRKGDKPKTDELSDDFRSAQSVVSGVLNSAGVDPTPSGDDAKVKAAAVAQFQEEVARQQRTFQQLKGKKATNDELQAIADGVVNRAVAIPNSWWHQLIGSPVTSKRLFDVTIEDVPFADRKNIETALQNRGIAVTDATIVQAFIDLALKAKK